MEAPDFIIDLETAKRWADKWRKDESSYFAKNELHAFLIPKEDVIQVLAEGIDAVRGYLGIDDNGEPKFMIVGTKYDHVTETFIDMIPGKYPGANIYDFSRPCPNACDNSSPLNE
ncbi:hypothetical protein AAEO56_00560 [Flavobacterium sp. DGU11]|uniref:Uncharacterized protein n=1 Tax=Flavobacterium arundinis TaxID=3139143 RepID=A0ABU9HRE8_9FLAO